MRSDVVQLSQLQPSAWRFYLLNAHRLGYASDEPSLREYFCIISENLFLHLKKERLGKLKLLWACLHFGFFLKKLNHHQLKDFQDARVSYLFTQMSPQELVALAPRQFPDKLTEIEDSVCAHVERQLLLTQKEETLATFFSIYHMRWFFEIFASMLPTIMLVTGLVLFFVFAIFIVWHSLDTSWLEFFTDWWNYLKIVFKRGE